MKKYFGYVGALAIAALICSSAQAQIKGDPSTQTDAREIPLVHTGSTVVPGNCTALLESTGFESDTADGGWDSGFQICGPEYDDADCLNPQTAGCTPPAANENCCLDFPNVENCWATSSASPSCKQPSISSSNPSTLKGPSTQHLHIEAQPGVGGSHQAFSPLQSITTAGLTTMKFDLYGSATGGAAIRFRAFDDTATVGHAFAAYMFFVTSALGQPYILIDPGTPGGTQFFAGYWTPGEYKQVEVISDPCRIPSYPGGCGQSLIYKYDGVEIYNYATNGVAHACPGHLPATGGQGSQMPSVERVNWLFLPNSGTAFWDVDNYSISRGAACAYDCGDGFVDPPETCEPGIPDNTPGGCQTGHTCFPEGDPNECTCSRICTLADPCILGNGANGPYAGPCDAAYGCLFLYDADTESASINTCGSVGIDSRIFFWGSWNDITDPGNGNDDCCDPASPNCGSFGVGSDPSAPCYGPAGESPPYPSCTCHDLPMPGDSLFVAQTNVPSGSQRLAVNITKKIDCGDPIDGGACCDGVTGLCTQQPTETTCLALSDQTIYYPNKTCDIVPECIRHTGACCDGTPKAEHCTMGTYPEDCDGPNQTWVKGGDCGAVPSICPAVVLGACCNTLEGSCTDNQIVADCSGAQRVFTLDGTCANTLCDAVLGACCDTDPFGGCTDVTNAECQGDKLVWTKGGSCATTECVHNAIPTVSTWGLAILTLLLLTGAKIYFGRRQAATA